MFRFDMLGFGTQGLGLNVGSTAGFEALGMVPGSEFGAHLPNPI